LCPAYGCCPTGNTVLSIVSQDADSVSHIRIDSPGKPIDTSSLVGLKARGAAINALSRTKLKPIPGIVKNSKQ
jgi:hypothetical protein